MSQIWLIIIILAIIIELITVDLVSIWFVFGAIIALIGDLLGLDRNLQIILFTITSILIIILVRPIAKKHFKTNKIPTNSDRFIGKVATVTKEISDDNRGEVKVSGSYWSAETIDHQVLEIGSKCIILTITGNHMIVRGINEGEK